MKLPIKAFAVSVSLCMATSQAFAGQDTITYKNSRGSILELEFNQKEKLKGTFTTAVASKDCQDVIGVKRPLIGYIDNSAITFSINYPTCGSVVSLTGHINENREKISTIAIIARQTSTYPEAIGSQFITHDTFVKVDKVSE